MGYETQEAADAVQALIDANGGHSPDDDAVFAVVSQYEPVEGWDNGVKVGTSSTPAAAETTSPTSESQTESKSESKTETSVENKTEEPEEPVHEHSYRKEITKMPTCTEEGVTTYTCECGDSYTEPIPATGHDEGEWETETEPTCTTEGKELLKCTRDGEVLDERPIPALGHTPGEWEVTKEADWIHNGEQIRKCTVCGEILDTQVIPANHTPLYIIGGCALAVILIIVIIAVKVRKKKMNKADKSSK